MTMKDLEGDWKAQMHPHGQVKVGDKNRKRSNFKQQIWLMELCNEYRAEVCNKKLKVDLM